MGFAVITVKERQVVEIGENILLLVKKGRGRRQYRLVIKAPKEIYIKRTDRTNIESDIVIKVREPNGG